MRPVLGSVSEHDEHNEAAAEAGVDALVNQGPAAGGHSDTLTRTRPPLEIETRGSRRRRTVRRREAVRAEELAAQGHLLRLWKPPLIPGEWRTLGLFAADDENELQSVLASMPLHVWMTVTVTPLTPHPSDPGADWASTQRCARTLRSKHALNEFRALADRAGNRQTGPNEGGDHYDYSA